jgi:REP element-mobilizing transposase RayT
MPNDPTDQTPRGFRALRCDRAVSMYQRSMPHWRQAGATYFVTFRLADSLPSSKLAELRDERDRWCETHPEPSDFEHQRFEKQRMQRIETWLDAGHGACLLKKQALQKQLAACLQRFQDQLFQLGAFAIVPNHVHLVVRPHEKHPLENLIGAWKRFSAVAINRSRGLTGNLWQEESFDRIIRDTPHLRKVINYTERNLEKAQGVGTFWLNPAWEGWYRMAEEGKPTH